MTRLNLWIAIATALALQCVPAAAEPLLSQQDEFARNIELVDIKYTFGGFNNILVIKVKLKNRGTVRLKDFVFECVTVSASGTVLDRPSHTLYQSLAPGQAKTFPGVSVGFINSQTKQAGCEVISATEQNS